VGRGEGVQMVLFGGADVNDEGEEDREDDEAGSGGADSRADVVQRVVGISRMLMWRQIRLELQETRESQELRELQEFGRVAGLPDGVVDGTGFPASACGMAALDAAPGLERRNSGLGSNLWDLVSWLQGGAVRARVGGLGGSL
jgi:hypothetical protein